ncbi:MAG: hypothetical protein AMDU4_FER2C00191G0003 [Ferroplasma sp. Type II]|nr:MAG: hypothetical protein AMDU4_FER2C00191G0003 [Ferroplasma sp. Type II]
MKLVNPNIIPRPTPVIGPPSGENHELYCGHTKGLKTFNVLSGALIIIIAESTARKISSKNDANLIYFICGLIPTIAIIIGIIMNASMNGIHIQAGIPTPRKYCTTPGRTTPDTNTGIAAVLTV